MTEAAKKIIDGLKQAAKSAKCEHDWEFVEGRTAYGDVPMRIISKCPYCGCRKTEYVDSAGTRIVK